MKISTTCLKIAVLFIFISGCNNEATDTSGDNPVENELKTGERPPLRAWLKYNDVMACDREQPTPELIEKCKDAIYEEDAKAWNEKNKAASQ